MAVVPRRKLARLHLILQDLPRANRPALHLAQRARHTPYLVLLTGRMGTCRQRRQRAAQRQVVVSDLCVFEIIHPSPFSFFLRRDNGSTRQPAKVQGLLFNRARREGSCQERCVLCVRKEEKSCTLKIHSTAIRKVRFFAAFPLLACIRTPLFSVGLRRRLSPCSGGFAR